MAKLCIQIQPQLAPEMSIDRRLLAVKKIATNKTLFEEFEWSTGNDNGAYINLLFEANDHKSIWKLFRRELYEDSEIGIGLANSSIATCQGQRGWDDYLLLFHFDPTVKLDDIEE
jgi:hypothetical protein